MHYHIKNLELVNANKLYFKKALMPLPCAKP